MPELSYKVIGGVTFLLILLASGTTYYLAETNDYKSCRGTWDLQEDGMYQCSKTLEKYWCYSVEYRGSGWYRCNVGKVVNVEQPKPEQEYSSEIFCNGKPWQVPENPQSYTRIKSESGETYFGECLE